MLVDGYQSQHIFISNPAPILQLDKNVVVMIFGYLDLQSRASLAMTCKQLNNQFGHGAQFKKIPDHRPAVRRINRLRNNRSIAQRTLENLKNDRITQVAVVTMGVCCCVCCSSGIALTVGGWAVSCCGAVPMNPIANKVLCYSLETSSGVTCGSGLVAFFRECWLNNCTRPDLETQSKRLETVINERVGQLYFDTDYEPISMEE